MITQLTDFVDEIDIPQAVVTPSNESVQRMINKYEPRFLNTLFGDSFAALFTAGIAADPVDARWTAILELPDFKLAIADYIYYYWLRKEAVQNMGTGTGRSKNTNSNSVSPGDKMCRAWFEMYTTNWKVLKFLGCNADTYPEYCLPRWYYPFSVIWGSPQWNWNINIFYSNVWDMWWRNYEIPDVFKPLSRL
jgi:hypothetical protein